MDMSKDAYLIAQKIYSGQITFNNDVDQNTVTSDTVYILNRNGEKVDGITFKTKNDQVEVYAPEKGYTSGEAYTLHITDNVQSVKGVSLKEAKMKKFTIK